MIRSRKSVIGLNIILHLHEEVYWIDENTSHIHTPAYITKLLFFGFVLEIISLNRPGWL